MVLGNIFILCIGALLAPAGVLLIIFRRAFFRATVAGQKAAFGRLASRSGSRLNPNGNVYIFVGILWIFLGVVMVVSSVTNLSHS
jgi:uncharacterized membrane protein